jgi:hypothetical protein
VTNQKHNSCKIYLKIIQVVSKGRKISWFAGGVIGYTLLKITKTTFLKNGSLLL